MKVTHTHRGHCQLCAHIQAIEPVSGLIAKHGYTVEHGYFSGTCPGSDLPSLHVQRSVADERIAEARKDAFEMRLVAAALRSGFKQPAHAWSGEYVVGPLPRGTSEWERPKRYVPFNDAPKIHQREAVEAYVTKLAREADVATAYADDLTKWADQIYGKVDAYRVEDLEPRAWAVGDPVRIGGNSKDGFDAQLEAIENRPYKSYGFSRRNTQTMVAHARVTRPARTEKKSREGFVTRTARPAETYWEPLRNLKRPPSALAERMRKEGKL